MSDLIQVLPELDTQSFSHVLPSLEKALISTNDLITLDAVDVAKRAQVPASEVKRLADKLLRALHAQLGFEAGAEEGAKDEGVLYGSCDTISTLDDSLDIALNGGFPTAQLIEVTGER